MHASVSIDVRKKTERNERRERRGRGRMKERMRR